jgi:phosphohistidine phosphatase
VTARADRRQLYLLRHADAGDPETWLGDDAARPLSPKGRDQAERLATFLHGVRLTVDVVITSPKVRARETAEIVADGLGHAGKVRIDDRLAGGVRPGTVDDLIRDAGSPGSVVIVGHDPDFSELVAALAGAPGLTMKKGAMARVDLRGNVADADGTLRWLVPPELLDRDRR